MINFLGREPNLQTIGIIGGLSWTSTQRYYQLINQQINHRIGREASAEIFLRSVNFQEIIDLQIKNDWTTINQIMANAAKSLAMAGADFFLIASNTMHLAYESVSNASRVPGLNIFTAIADSLHAMNIRRIGLLGTRYTMSMPFFKDSYEMEGIVALTPEKNDARSVNQIIFKELIHHRTAPGSRIIVDQVIDRMIASGSEAIVLGCTELELLFPELQKNVADDRGWFSHPSGIKIIDSTRIHAFSAVKWALSESSIKPDRK